MNKVLTILMSMLCLVGFKAKAQVDPTLAGMIFIYTDKAKGELKAQERAMMLETTGHIWLREEYDETTKLQRKFNEYLNSFRSIVSYAAQVYGFYHEVSMMTDNLGNFTEQLKKAPGNALAVALSARRNAIYREIIYGSVDICNDIRNVCLSNTKMTEKERIEIVFNIRPKLKLMNRKLRQLTLAVKYTTMNDLWAELDIRAKSYDVDKKKIGSEAYQRWRRCSKVKPGGGGGGSGSGPIIIRPWKPWPWIPRDSLIYWPKDSLIINKPIRK